MKAHGLALALAACALPAGAGAAEIKILDVKAFLYLEHAGKFSNDVLGGPAFVNAPRGGAPGGDSATGVLIELTFAGEKNGAPKYATASVDLTQSGRNGQSVVTRKAFASFAFGPDGYQHKALLLDNATCMPLTIDVRAGKTRKTAKLDFQCGE
jgi:hypothetical protein